MSGKLQVVGPNDGVRSEFEGMVEQRSLATLATGSTDMKFEHAVCKVGLFVEGVVNDTQDEYAYVISGGMEVTCDGQTHKLAPGSFFFVPKGTAYDMKVTEGPMEVIGVFPPSA